MSGVFLSNISGLFPYHWSHAPERPCAHKPMRLKRVWFLMSTGAWAYGRMGACVRVFGYMRS